MIEPAANVMNVEGNADGGQEEDVGLALNNNVMNVNHEEELDDNEAVQQNPVDENIPQVNVSELVDEMDVNHDSDDMAIADELNQILPAASSALGR